MGKTERDFKTIAMIFNLAESVHLEINGEKYEGELEEIKIGEHIVYRLGNVTAEIINLPLGTDKILFKVINSVGAIKTFQTSLMKKKLPRLMLSFPDREASKVIRTTQRVYTNIKTPVFYVKSKNTLLPPNRYGLGTLTNIGEGGCSITLNMDIGKEDRIDFFLEVNSEEVGSVKPKDSGGKVARQKQKENPAVNKKKTLELSGIVKSKVELSEGVYNFGVQFVGLDRDTEKDISAYMKRRTTKRKMARR